MYLLTDIWVAKCVGYPFLLYTIVIYPYFCFDSRVKMCYLREY